MKIAQYLKTSGERDATFAKRLGVSVHAVRKYKSGVRIPRPKTILRIKKVTKEAVSESDWYN